MPPAGIEQAQQYSSFGNADVCAAKISAIEPKSEPVDAALVEIIDAWETLPEAAQAAILAMVRGAPGAT